MVMPAAEAGLQRGTLVQRQTLASTTGAAIIENGKITRSEDKRK
jgi:hypothetical protein